MIPSRRLLGHDEDVLSNDLRTWRIMWYKYMLLNLVCLILLDIFKGLSSGGCGCITTIGDSMSKQFRGTRCRLCL